MIVETAQMLSTAHQLNGSPYKDKVYKATHINHPCNIWVRKTKANYLWALDLLKNLISQYEDRYKKEHKTNRLVKYFEDYIPIKKGKLTEFPQAMPEEYRSNDVVTAYRNYYIKDKSRFAKWNYCNTPSWFKDGMV